MASPKVDFSDGPFPWKARVGQGQVGCLAADGNGLSPLPIPQEEAEGLVGVEKSLRSSYLLLLDSSREPGSLLWASVGPTDLAQP